MVRGALKAHRPSEEGRCFRIEDADYRLLDVEALLAEASTVCGLAFCGVSK
jgi:hypothetical protein